MEFVELTIFYNFLQVTILLRSLVYAVFYFILYTFYLKFQITEKIEKVANPNFNIDPKRLEIKPIRASKNQPLLNGLSSGPPK